MREIIAIVTKKKLKLLDLGRLLLSQSWREMTARYRGSVRMRRRTPFLRDRIDREKERKRENGGGE